MKSSRQLIQDAKDYRFNPMIPLKIYLKTCVGILDKAQMSVQCGDSEMAFMFYYRYVDLCTNKLARHPQCLSKGNTDPEIQLYKQEYLQLIKLEVPAVLKLIEDLQKQIDRQYNKHQLSLAKNIAKPTKNLINNRNDKTYSNAIGNMERSSQDDTIKYPFLPKTFNEHRFNQSLAFFNTTLAHENSNTNNNNNNNNNNNHNHNHSNNNNSNINQATNNDTTKQETNSNNETPIFHYPELPHISFPTF